MSRKQIRACLAEIDSSVRRYSAELGSASAALAIGMMKPEILTELAVHVEILRKAKVEGDDVQFRNALDWIRKVMNYWVSEAL